MRRRATWLLLAFALALIAVAGVLNQRGGGPGTADGPSRTTPSPATTPSPTPTPTPTPRSAAPRAPAEATTVLEGTDAATRAVAMSRALFSSAPVVVLAPAEDAGSQLRAASIGVALGVPVLLTGGDPSVVTAELARLGASDVVLVGAAEVQPWSGGSRQVPAPADDGALAVLLGLDPPGPPVEVDAAVGDVAAVSALRRGHLDLLVAPVPPPPPAAGQPPVTDPPPATPPVAPDPTGESSTADPMPIPSPTATGAAPLEPTHPSAAVLDALVLTDGDPSTLAAVATARAAGVTVVQVPGGDPRASSTSIRAIAADHTPGTAVVAVGPSFGTPADLAWQVATAATGVELPGGGQLLLPGRRLVALYGSPGTPALGLLGEQDLPASIARAQQYAAEYQALSPVLAVPAFEIIATIASRGPGPDGNYSDETSPDALLPWVQAARDAGIYVVLDLQPGRTDFLTQAQLYASLLAEPNVGLALDPEWRLAPDQVHLRQIGSVGVEEVNAVASWLATFTRERALPQKLFVLHQFAGRMIAGREGLDMSHRELAVMVHVDGQGSQPAKAGTWAALRRDAPAGLWWGWKNFIDEDVPMLTPEQTLQVVPTPDLITYQ